MYLVSGNPACKLYSLEGCPETAEIARKNFDSNDFNCVKVITGNFNNTLHPLLSELKHFDMAYVDGNHTYEATMLYFKTFTFHIHAKSVIIFDDIYWSAGMQKAWEEIKADPRVTISLDFYQFGVVFFDNAFTKQNFNLRL
jgi:predicted O-methyltransferase YrrM